MLPRADFKRSRQCQETTKREWFALEVTGRTTSPKRPGVMPLFKALVRLHLEYCVRAWATYLLRDEKWLEEFRHVLQAVLDSSATRIMSRG